MLTITPYNYLYDFRFHNVKNCCDAGPVQFLNLLYGASLVVTDSYHGTALSVNLNKPFYSIEINHKDSRIKELLEKVEASERFLVNVDLLLQVDSYDMDYECINSNLSPLTESSKEYLYTALNNKQTDKN